MKKFEVITTGNLGPQFYGVDISNTMKKLKQLVYRNKAFFSSVFSQDTKIGADQKLSTISQQQLQRIKQIIQKKRIIKKYLIRSVRINVKFNEETGQLQLNQQKQNTLCYKTLTESVCCKNQIFFDSPELENLQYRYYQADNSFQFVNLDQIYDQLQTLIEAHNQNVDYSIISNKVKTLLFKKGERLP